MAIVLILVIVFFPVFFFSFFLFSLLGLASLFFIVVLFVRNKGVKPGFIITLALSAFFSLWMFALYKESYGDPTLLEKFVSDSFPRKFVIQDLFYHTPIVQMIKNYGV